MTPSPSPIQPHRVGAPSRDPGFFPRREAADHPGIARTDSAGAPCSGALAGPPGEWSPPACCAPASPPGQSCRRTLCNRARPSLRLRSARKRRCRSCPRVPRPELCSPTSATLSLCRRTSLSSPGAAASRCQSQSRRRWNRSSTPASPTCASTWARKLNRSAPWPSRTAPTSISPPVSTTPSRPRASNCLATS